MNRVASALKKVNQWRGAQSSDEVIDGPSGDIVPAAGHSASAAEAQGAATAGNRNGGWFDANSLAGSTLISGDSRYARASDEFQVLCATLQSLASAQDKHLFAITSALAGEGKSFVALNLAAGLARNGGRVLLVDANLNRPSLHRALRMARRCGLCECLSGKAAFEASIQATGLAGLGLISAGGAINSPPPELFANLRMREFVAAAKAAYARDFVVIDCAAMLTSAEAQIIARMADAVLMVVAANRTPRHCVARALGRLSGSIVAGMVLNRFDPCYSYRAEYLSAPSQA